jgi:ubiquinone biosynthesis protein UbiJ
MAEPPDFQELARRYLALWQDQLMATASDPELSEMLARFFALAAPTAAWTSTLWRQMQAGAAPTHDHVAPEQPPEPARAAPAAVAPDDRGGSVDRLSRRIAALEERLARLEAGARRRGPRTRSPPRRHRL